MAAFPQYQILHGTYKGIEVYVAMQAAAGPSARLGPLTPAQGIVNVNNPPSYPYAYVVGSGAAGSHTYASAAAALAAAEADVNALITARDATAPPEVALVLLPDSPVFGPA